MRSPSITWSRLGSSIRRRQSAQISALANLFPHANVTPTLANSCSNYQYSSRQAVTPYHWDSRFDYRISSKDNVFVAWSQYSATPNNAGGLIPNLMQANADVTDKSHVVTIDEAHVFSSNLTNEFIFAIGSGALQTLSPAEISYANGTSNPFNSIFQNTGDASGGNTGHPWLEYLSTTARSLTSPARVSTNTFSHPITRGNSPTT